MSTVVLVSADGEWKVLKSLLSAPTVLDSPLGAYFDRAIGVHPIRFFHGGWGRVSAAATTQYVIDQFHPDLLINLGTCRGFEGRIEQGEIILVDRTVIYDIFEQMTDEAEAIDHYSTDLDLQWLPTMLPSPVSRGLLISGDRDIVDIDRSITLFLSEPESYEGGELMVETEYGPREAKLPAGDAIVYPTIYYHEVKPVTKGERLAAVMWIQSLIKEPFPSTMNFYKLFGTIGGAYAELFPTIGEERPDVMAKMMGLANEMDEIELKARKAGFPNR